MKFNFKSSKTKYVEFGSLLEHGNYKFLVVKSEDEDYPVLVIDLINSKVEGKYTNLLEVKRDFNYCTIHNSDKLTLFVDC